MNCSLKGYVKSICVHPNWRKQGIGHKLMEYAEKRIFRETPNVFICVSGFNVIAKRFYEKLGYDKIGELQDFIIKGESEVLLRKTIAPLWDYKKKRK
jgi:ribosomal protein S18 acetylase RimI-like enzyme